MATKQGPKLDFGGTGKTSMVRNPFVGGFFGSGASSMQGAPPPNPTLPDFGQTLAQDPFYQAALASLTAQGVYDKSSRDAALRTAYIRMGGVPEGFDLGSIPADLRGEVGSIIDASTRSAAQQNTAAGLSILARLKDAAQQQNKRTVDVIGGRGIFRTGETGYQLGRNQLAASQAQYDSMNKFLDYIMGVQAAYVAAERQRQALLLQEQRDAAGRAGPPTGPPTTGTPTGPPTGPPGPQRGHAPQGPGEYQANPYVDPDTVMPGEQSMVKNPILDALRESFKKKQTAVGY